MRFRKSNSRAIGLDPVHFDEIFNETLNGGDCENGIGNGEIER
jgi:hypothetical protein